MIEKNANERRTMSCPCGLDGHLCPGARMLAGSGPDELYAAGLRAARRWQAAERLAAGVR